MSQNMLKKWCSPCLKDKVGCVYITITPVVKVMFLLG